MLLQRQVAVTYVVTSCTRNDKYLCDIIWVDHWVDQNTALTIVSANEILSTAKITAVGWCLY